MSAQVQIGHTLTSQLFPLLFDALDPSRPLVVINLGPATSGTVAFFSQFRCRLYFIEFDVTALEQLMAGWQGQELSEAEKKAAVEAFFRQQISLPDGLQIDLFLFWDSLNQLDDRSLTALSRVLAPHIHKRSQGHGFAVHNKSSVPLERHYGVDSERCLQLVPLSPPRRLSHSHTQSALNQLFKGMTVQRSVLHGDGRLEVLFKAAL